MNFDKLTKTKKAAAKRLKEDIVLYVKLFPTTKDEFPMFNFAELVKEQLGSSALEGINVEEDSEEHRKLKEIAKKFEQKYGGDKKEKFGDIDDYIDLGMGYDASDPFIDDSEAYDEMVPSSLALQKGGFYVNKGVLNFRDVSVPSGARRTAVNVKIKKIALPSRDSEKPSCSSTVETSSGAKSANLIESKIQKSVKTADKLSTPSSTNIDEDDIPLALAVRPSVCNSSSGSKSSISPAKRRYCPPGLPPLSKQHKKPLKKLLRKPMCKAYRSPHKSLVSRNPKHSFKHSAQAVSPDKHLDDVIASVLGDCHSSKKHGFVDVSLIESLISPDDD